MNIIEIKERIKNETNLQYLFDREPDRFQALKEDRQFSTHGQVVDGKLVHCLVGGVSLPAGTVVAAFQHMRVGYSEYQQIGDELYGAPGAEKWTTGSDWTLVTITEIDGVSVVASTYVSTPAGPKITIGHVPANN